MLETCCFRGLKTRPPIRPKLQIVNAIYEKKASHNLESCNAFIAIKLLSYLS